VIKADLHIHSVYSGDSKSQLEQIIDRCIAAGINCVAITDHNTIEGAIQMQKIAPFKVIVGEEIHTASGEVIGYYLTQGIPKRLPVKETVLRIKQQGGLIGVPHPFDRLRGSSIHKQALAEILPDIDIIETLNARSILHRSNSKAKRFAIEHGLAVSAGSDAHTVKEIGNAYVEMSDFNTKEEFLLALSEGRVVGHLASRWVHLWSSWAKIMKV
jgi:predicted metal-dependent phosphoesterase TrpH